MSTESQCAFCDIEGLGFQVIHQDDQLIVIHSRRPLGPGHVMILPKNHRPDFVSLNIDEGLALIKMIQLLSRTLSQTYRYTGLNIFSNIGKAGGQTVPHLHVHLVPRFDQEVKSPFQILNSPELYQQLRRLSPEGLREEVAKIRNSLHSVRTESDINDSLSKS